jgi:hypothetical protein
MAAGSYGFIGFLGGSRNWHAKHKQYGKEERNYLLFFIK